MTQLRTVAHVLRRFAQSDWGGTETVVFNVAKDLERQGIRSPLFTTHFLSSVGRELLGPVEVRRFRATLPWIGLSQEGRQQLELKGGSPLSFGLFKALLREPELDLIHSHVLNRLGGIARTVARLRGIPYVVTIHGGCCTLSSEQADLMKGPTEGTLEWGKAFGLLLGSRRVLDDADAIIAVGRDEYQGLQKRFPEKAVHYLPNGVDVHRFEQANAGLFRREYGLRPEQKVVLCVSRIDSQKNQMLLLKAFAASSQLGPEDRLVLIGPVTVPRYYKELLNEAERLGVSKRLLLIPGLAQDDPLLTSAFKAADVFVLPSKMEPFGIVVLEAWAAGVPVVASHVGGIPFFCSDLENALLFESENIQECTDALDAALGQTELRQRLVAAARKAVDAYSWPKITKELLAIYAQVREAHGSAKQRR